MGKGPDVDGVVEHPPSNGISLTAGQVAELHGHGVSLLQSQYGFELLGVWADRLSRSTVVYLAWAVSSWVPLMLPGCRHVP